MIDMLPNISKKVELLRALSVLLCFLSIIFGCAPESRTEGKLEKVNFISGEPSNKPFEINLCRPKKLDLPADEVEKIRKLSHPLKEGMTASLILHVLDVHGLDAKFDHPELTSGQDLLKLFTDDEASRTFFGAPTMTRSRYGIRCSLYSQVRSAKEHHQDQALDVFANMGILLSTPIMIAEEEYHLRDMLIDSVANFDLQQKELDWTAFGFAAYLPPITSWRNKYGEEFTFDDLAETIMARPLNSGSCSGSHLVWAMIAMARVDAEKTPILSAPIRKKLNKRLEEIVQVTLKTQNEDGSWGTDWNVPLLSEEDIQEDSLSAHDTQKHKLIATSHIPDWLMHLPKDLQVPDKVIHRAGRWLHQQWRDADSNMVHENFCPCSHTAAVLGILADEESK